MGIRAVLYVPITVGWSSRAAGSLYVMCVQCKKLAVAAKSKEEMAHLINDRTYSDKTGPSVYVFVCASCESSYTPYEGVNHGHGAYSFEVSQIPGVLSTANDAESISWCTVSGVILCACLSTDSHQ